MVGLNIIETGICFFFLSAHDDNTSLTKNDFEQSHLVNRRVSKRRLTFYDYQQKCALETLIWKKKNLSMNFLWIKEKLMMNLVLNVQSFLFG